MDKNGSDQRGQSSIEFVLTLVLLVTFIMFYLQLTLVFAFGNYIHYATFMSARAYLSGGESPADQESRARDVIMRMLRKPTSTRDRLPMVAKGFGEGDPAGFVVEPAGQARIPSRDLSWKQGVRYTFKSRIFPINFDRFGASDRDNPAFTLKLTSESWLGRDPTYEECKRNMEELGGIFDNGC